MDALRNQLNRPLVAGIVGAVVGLFVGLILLGWWLWPVQWTDASPAQLQEDYQADYLRMAIDSFIKTQDQQTAKARWDYLGDKAAEALDAVKNDPIKLQNAEIEKYAQTVTTKVEATTEEEKGGLPTWVIVVVMCVVTLLIAGGIIVFVLFRGGKTPGLRTPAEQAEDAKRQVEQTDYSTSEAPPIAQFMASYKQGDDLFDDSFSIDSPSGEFLGECGVGISETIGVGDPKKVTAFEVWLFDKNDIQTVTKVLMSAHAFNDEAVKQRLAAKGEPVEARTGEKVVLETQTLKLEARVVDMNYGEGALPPESFFDQTILELAIWQK
jgi:hypothetical protein